MPFGERRDRAVVDALGGEPPRARAGRCAGRRARASSRSRRSSPVISSASISFNPRPNRWGASRLSGRVTTSPPVPADPRGRPWQEAQLSERPAPIAIVVLMSPSPSSTPGPCDCSRVNLRWKICRPRRIARNGSRLITNAAESGVIVLPAPRPDLFRDGLVDAVQGQVGRLASGRSSGPPPARGRRGSQNERTGKGRQQTAGTVPCHCGPP